VLPVCGARSRWGGKRRGGGGGGSQEGGNRPRGGDQGAGRGGARNFGGVDEKRKTAKESGRRAVSCTQKTFREKERRWSQEREQSAGQKAGVGPGGRLGVEEKKDQSGLIGGELPGIVEIASPRQQKRDLRGEENSSLTREAGRRS